MVFDHNSPKYTFTQNGHQNDEPIKLNGKLHVIHNAGVTELQGYNDYAGQTDLNGGTLVLNAFISGDGTMFLNPGATLAGRGIYSGLLDARGTMAPGQTFTEFGENVTTGTLTSLHMTWRGGAIFECDMDNAAGVSGTGWDCVASARDLTIDATPASPIRIALRSLSGGAPGPAANFDGLDRGSWVIATAGPSNSIIGFSPDKFVVDTTEFAHQLLDGKFSMQASNRELRLVFTRSLLDVMTVDDLVEASSSNSPATEQASKATDNTVETKYLNFGEIYEGFTVHVSGSQPVRALSLMSANDAPERDPASYQLTGSFDGVTFFPVASGSVPPFAARHAIQTIPFVNTTAYPIYRVIFPSVQNSLAADSMQIAEVELLKFSEITSPADTLSATLPPGGFFTTIPGSFDPSYTGQLFDHKMGVSNLDDPINFQIGNATGGNTVVDIVPAAGPTVLKGFEIIDPSDAWSRKFYRPSSVTVAGSNDGINFTSLKVVIPPVPVNNLEIHEYATLANNTLYARYRITFGPPVGGEYLDVGEFRLFGTVGPAPTALDDWRLAHFGTSANTGTAANTFDADHDGRVNFLEFATDGHPKSGSDSGKIVSSVADLGGTDYLVLTLPVRIGATFSGSGEKISTPVDGLLYHIQGSTDLTEWTTTPVIEVTPALVAGMPALDLGWTYRTFRFQSQAGKNHGYLRAKIETIP